MLVLRRKNRETIHIGSKEDFKNGNETIITIFRDKGSDEISIGIDAGDEMKILRGELVQKYLENLENDG
jgi:sRNA-binding carbon storage regulator CsrA